MNSSGIDGIFLSFHDSPNKPLKFVPGCIAEGNLLQRKFYDSQGYDWSGKRSAGNTPGIIFFL